MQAARFALTKIHPPKPRRGQLERPALEQRLAAALGSARLVLLSTPAGFGKTVLLTRLLATLDPSTALAWVACDEDDDLHRVLDCLTAALEPFDLPWRVEPEALVAAAVPEREALRRAADGVLNALAGSERRGVIVLDDMHRLADPAVFTWCDLLLERLPAHWTLVISSRVDPPLALPRLRALGELAEFRTEDLRFSPDEALALARHYTPDLPVEPLWQRTQGWAAGLRLALSVGGLDKPAARAAADRHAFDYLVSEVLDALPVNLRLFLLRSSVLPELEAGRCAAVTGHADAALLLDDTEARGLFVSVLEGDDATLKLHDLFRDCLEDRLARERPQELPGLLQRAADTEPDTQRRIGYLLRGGHWAQAQEVLEQEAPRLVGQGAVESLLRLIEQFPPAWRARAPGLDFADGIAAWARWSFSRMAEAMVRATAGYQALGDEHGVQRASAYHVVAMCGQGHVRESIEPLDRLDRQPLPDDVRVLVQLLRTWHQLARCELQELPAQYALTVDTLERLDRAELWSRCQTLLPFVGVPGMGPVLARYLAGAQRHLGEAPSTLRAGTQAVRACVLLWQGRLGPAYEALQAAEDDYRWLGKPLSVAAFTRTARALWHAWHGERDAALAAAQGLLDDLDDPRSRDRRQLWRGYYQMFMARIALQVGDVETLRLLQQRVPPRPGPLEPALLALQRTALDAHLAWAEGRWQEACEGYDAALRRDEPRLVVFGQHIEIRLRWAHACMASGQADRAWAVLEPVPALVGRDQVGALLMAGPTVLLALADAARGRAPAPLQADLARWAATARDLCAHPVAALPQRASPGLTPAEAAVPAADLRSAGRLSEREIEVLERIAAGDSNKLIARAFDLSPHTVKRHVANVLDKLDLSSRGQAAAWYRDWQRLQHRGPGHLSHGA